MAVFYGNLVYFFLIAFGITLGSGAFAGLAALLNNHPPLKTMLSVSTSLRIWAVAAALGGTFSSIEALEQGVLTGNLKSVAKQLIYLASALLGANLGCTVIGLAQKCGELWLE